MKKNDKFKVIHPDEIVYNPMNMTLGSIGFNNSGKDVAVSGYYVTMKLNDGFDSMYFATWLTSLNAINLYKLYATGSLIERQRVQFPTLSGIRTLMPSLNEQNKLGAFFEQLDTTIALHQQKYDLLLRLKKAYLQQMFTQKGESTPKVRFADFHDNWEQRKWDKIVDRITTQSNDSTLPKVEFEDIVSGEGRLNKDVSSKFDDRKGIIFAPDQILFGKLRPYLQNWLLADFKGIALGDFWVFDANKHSSLFVYYLMQSTKYQTVANLSSGTKMPRSDWKTVSQTEFGIPKDRAEEYQIGILFENLDSLITLHQQKIASLKSLKQAYLQKMFV